MARACRTAADYTLLGRAQDPASPLLYLSAFFEATRREYYDRLRGVTEAGRWGDWVEYFLNGVARQSEDALSRAERINTILTKWQKQMIGAPSKAPSQLVDLLAENPFCTITGVAQRLGVAFTTAQRAIDKLVRARILERSSEATRSDLCARAVSTFSKSCHGYRKRPCEASRVPGSQASSCLSSSKAVGSRRIFTGERIEIRRKQSRVIR